MTLHQRVHMEIQEINEIISIIRKKTGTDDAGLVVNELIQIACGLAFEWLGEKNGKADVIQMVEACYKHAIKN